MNKELAGKKLQLGSSRMKYWEAVKIKDLPWVLIHDLPNHKVNVRKNPTTVWVGKKCSDYAFCIFFPNATVKGEIKSTTIKKTQIALTGKSSNTFEQERKRAIDDGIINIDGRSSFFLFATNANMTENNEKIENVVKADSMFVNSSRWESTFTYLFWFHIPNNNIASNIEKNVEEDEMEVEKEKSYEKKKKRKKNELEDDYEQEGEEERKASSIKKKRKKLEDDIEQQSKPKRKFKQCVAVCKNGEQCKVRCYKGDNLCYHHKPTK